MATAGGLTGWKESEEAEAAGEDEEACVQFHRLFFVGFCFFGIPATRPEKISGPEPGWSCFLPELYL